MPAAAEPVADKGNYLLAQMHDIVLPPAIAWWPDAPGWNLLLGLLGAWLCWRGWRVLRQWQRDRYRRVALRELALLERAVAVHTAELVQLPALLKSVALQGFAREQVAALSGGPWLEFLDRHCAGSGFCTEAGRTLLHVSYANPQRWQLSAAQVATLLEQARHWIRHHRVVIRDA